MADPKIVRHVRMENTDTRNAWYEIDLEDYGGTYRVRIAFGPLGKKAIKNQRTGEMGFRYAEEYFDSKLKDKQAGGYKIVASNSASTIPGQKLSPAAAALTGRHPSHKWVSHGLTGHRCDVCGVRGGTRDADSPCRGAQPGVVPSANPRDLPEESIFKPKPADEKWAKLREERKNHAPWGKRK